MTPLRRRFSKTEKLEIVKLSLETEATVETLALRYKIHPNSIYKWRTQYASGAESAFPGNGNKAMTDEQKEIERLKRLNAELELEREILKKALGIFSSPNKRNLLS